MRNSGEGWWRELVDDAGDGIGEEEKKKIGYGGGRFVVDFIDARDLKLLSFSY